MDQLILGGPKWMDEELFEIDATWPPERIPHSAEELAATVRTLLADRFKLLVHTETRQVPSYRLVVARKDRRLGPELRPASDACVRWIEGGRRGAAPTSAYDKTPCFRQIASRTSIAWSAMTISHLADVLSSRVDRPVRDDTGLAGYFDLELHWAEPQPAGPDVSPPDADRYPTSIFTALKEQLGLGLEPAMGEVQVLVIDRLEHPTPN